MSTTFQSIQRARVRREEDVTSSAPRCGSKLSLNLLMLASLHSALYSSLALGSTSLYDTRLHEYS